MTDPTEFDPGVKQSFAFHDKPVKSSTGFRVHQLLFSLHSSTANSPQADNNDRGGIRQGIMLTIYRGAFGKLV